MPGTAVRADKELTVSDISVENLSPELNFDLLGFMDHCEETKLDGPLVSRLEEFWKDWEAMLSVKKLTCGKISYLVVWLPEEVETTVDELWDKTPSEGFLANALAQYLCMQAVSDLIPQVEISGCAPAPRPTESLKKGIESLGLVYRKDMPVPERRFSVVTLYPFRGGCEVCHLQKDCPKGSGSMSDSATYTFRGYERPGRDPQ